MKKLIFTSFALTPISESSDVGILGFTEAIGGVSIRGERLSSYLGSLMKKENAVLLIAEDNAYRGLLPQEGNIRHESVMNWTDICYPCINDITKMLGKYAGYDLVILVLHNHEEMKALCRAYLFGGEEGGLSTRLNIRTDEYSRDIHSTFRNADLRIIDCLTGNVYGRSF